MSIAAGNIKALTAKKDCRRCRGKGVFVKTKRIVSYPKYGWYNGFSNYIRTRSLCPCVRSI